MAKPNIIDRAIGWIAPGIGVRRMKNRAALGIMQRGYEGAKKGRLTNSWNTTSTSADAEIALAGAALRDRMRDLVRNNPHAAKALSVLVTTVIGAGIMPTSKDKKVNELFKEWSKVCDADGALDFYGIQGLAARGMFESGDGLVRRRRRRRSDGLPVPLQLQVVETDLIDHTRDGVLGTNGAGGTIINGIQYDALGKKTGYWMFRTHPGNNHYDPRTSFESSFVPAADIAHIFERHRTQGRGVPWGAPVIRSLFDLGAYEEAELTRKQLEACMVGVITPGTDGDTSLGQPLFGDDADMAPGVYDSDRVRIDDMQPGMFGVLHGGKDIKFNTPTANGSYESYKDSMLHTIAAGFRIPHAMLTTSLDKVNYSSSKFGLEDFKLVVTDVQWNIIIHALCDPLWDWFCEAAYLDGKIKSPKVPVTWTPPRFYSVDPKKDAEGRKAEVRAGFKTLREAIAETGRDPDEVFAEIAATNKMMDDLGIILDSDPRKMSGNGQVQQIGGDPDGDGPPSVDDKEDT